MNAVLVELFGGVVAFAVILAWGVAQGAVVSEAGLHSPHLISIYEVKVASLK